MKFDESKRSGFHHKLSLVVGDWKGTTKTWLGPDVLVDLSPMEALSAKSSAAGS